MAIQDRASVEQSNKIFMHLTIPDKNLLQNKAASYLKFIERETFNINVPSWVDFNDLDQDIEKSVYEYIIDHDNCKQIYSCQSNVFSGTL